MVQRLTRYEWDDWERTPRGIIIPESPVRMDYGELKFHGNIGTERATEIVQMGFSAPQAELLPGMDHREIYDNYRVSVDLEYLERVHQICGRKSLGERDVL